LANKLRAYALQELGLNTLQADRHLGFRADERDYAMACAMLKDLGFNRIQLMANNPDKLAALSACDIEVVGRMPLSAPVNAHNASYLRAKRDHAGHLDTGAEEI
jgi:GTP cyclohydrolase II